jgi:hypothetical protein
MQSGGARDQNGQRDQIGESHADQRVELNACQCLLALAGVLEERYLYGVRLGVLDFLGCLPEKQIRTNGGAQNGHDHHPKFL